MKNRAFTFIEILVVTAIISLLTGSSTVVYTGFSKQSRDARRKTDLQQVRTVLELYRSNNNAYPPALTFSQYLCDPAGCKEQGGTTYIEKLPQDPAPNKVYSYVYGEDNYLLSANLENGSKYCLNRYGEDDACSTLLAVIPTSTPIPQQPTATPIPWQPTNTPVPAQPTNTPIPQPTNTPIPQPTNTPIPTITPTPAPQPRTFNYTGSVQTYTVPQGISSLTIEAWGAQGSSSGSSGGLGGYAKGTISVSPGEILNVLVGGTNGYNGGAAGGPSDGGGGGGASDIRRGGTTLTNRIIDAGGGGGGGGAGITQRGGILYDAYGGAGGGTSGSSGGFFCSGGGGTQTRGGFGQESYDNDDCSCTWYNTPASGTLGSGGAGGAGLCGLYGKGGGGGGGGYYGGGGGNGPPGGGGGGGSSYVTGTNTVTTSGVKTGNGQIIITPY